MTCYCSVVLMNALWSACYRLFNTVGKLINFNKFQLIVSGVHDDVREKILEITGFVEGKLPLKCLHRANFSLQIVCIWLSGDKMTAKIRRWGPYICPYAGRITLVNSVLKGIYGIRASDFILPQEVIKRVEVACRNFLMEFITSSDSCGRKTLGC